jgi:GNAT superfamily N-acetyltransferase
MITLKPITILSEDMPECIALNVIPHKLEEEFVLTNALTLANAYYHETRELEPWICRAIYKDEKIVGLISYLYEKNHEAYKEDCYTICPIMVDKEYANQGIEAEALSLMLTELRAKPYGPANHVYAMYNPAEDDTALVYSDAGFAVADLDFSAVTYNRENIAVKLAL